MFATTLSLRSGIGHGRSPYAHNACVYWFCGIDGRVYTKSELANTTHFLQSANLRTGSLGQHRPEGLLPVAR